MAEGPLEEGEEPVGFALDPQILCAPSVRTSAERRKTPETRVSPKMNVSKTTLENHPSDCCSLGTGFINGRDLGSHEIHKYGGIWKLGQFVVSPDSQNATHGTDAGV